MSKDKKMPAPHEIQEVFKSFDYPINFAILAIMRSHRAVAASLLREIGLFPGQELMLMQLWEEDHQSQISLGKILRLDHSTVAKSVRRLEESGLVSRSRSEEDKRVTIVSLAPAGHDLKIHVLTAWSKLEAMTTEGLTEEEKSIFINLVKKMVSNIDSSYEI
ncbi:MarR family winged helix-turn-helix transcriptional regulator [Paenibacillus xylanexedens]|uniref:MarR family winged helix-turn-helix transcriptional regulator n=1 Tax=Paenibacillus xylanexedens TaxID=528191 RepID=UPI0021B50D26|nr:MarR family transcriptional regulator [Paenibacillus xylanexedens]